MLSRRDYLQIVDAALQSESYRFARQAALTWLGIFPGDLWVSYCLGEAQFAEAGWHRPPRLSKSWSGLTRSS